MPTLISLPDWSAFVPAPWLVLAVMGSVVVGLYRETFPPATTFFLGIMVLLLFQVLTPTEVLAGFANQQIATIILLVLLTTALRRNFNTEAFFDRVFRRARTGFSFRLQLMTTMAMVSSVLNNTPVVAVMTPYVYQWGKKHQVAPSRLLIPLSFATILGGMITLIGTSTNLVLNGFLQQNNEPLLGFTDFLWLGLLVSTVGIAFLALFSDRLLPENRDALDELAANSREYVVETKLLASSHLAGKTVQEAGLRNLAGVYLVEVLREADTIAPVPPDTRLQANDRLFFAGQTDTIVDLVNADTGLILPQPNKLLGQGEIDIVECVIPANSYLASKTVKEADFRQRYNAAIVAVHRNGERLRGKIGEMRLFAGDLLLLTVAKSFERNALAGRDLYIISKLREISHQGSKRLKQFGWIAPVIVTGSVLGFYNLFFMLLLLLFAMIMLQMIRLEDVKQTLDIDLIMILVLALALGNALLKTGAAELMAHALLTPLSAWGVPVVVAGLFILTVLLTTFVTNAAAVAIAFPIAYSLSRDLEMAGMPLYLTIAFGASAAFLTPIGYQTNLMVYGPGGYSFRDFLRIGLPMTVLYALTCLSFILFRYKLI